MSRTLTSDGEVRIAATGFALPIPWGYPAHENPSTPASPTAGDRLLFPKADGWYDLDSAGIETAFVLEARDNEFSGANSFIDNGLKLGTNITPAPIQGSIIASGGVLDDGYFSAKNDYFIAADAYFDGTDWRALNPTGATAGRGALIRSQTAVGLYAFSVYGDSTVRADGEVRTWTSLMDVRFTGQMLLPVTGSGGGLVMGGDVQIYRSAANTLRTPDSLTVDARLGVGGTTPTTHMVEIDAGATTTGTGLYARRNLAAASTDSPLAYFRQQHASDDQDTVLIDQAGTGYALNVGSGNTRLAGGLNIGSATSATSQGVLDIKADAGANPAIRLLDGDVSHPFTSPALLANMFATLSNYAGAAGGLFVSTISDADAISFGVGARVGATTTSVPAIILSAGKANGSGGTANLADTELHTRWTKWDGTVIATMYGNGTIITSGYADFILTDAATNTITNGVVYRHRTSGTPAANFGTALYAIADDNGLDDQTLLYIPSYWTDATHATRKSRTDFYAGDSAGVRLAFSIGANGTSQLMGFFGTAPIAKPTGVAVSAAGIHAALVSLGLIAA